MKKLQLLLASIFISMLLCFSSFAGQWKQDSVGWWYQNDDGGYPKSQWQSIDSKYYYFGDDGYMLHDCKTPDGYTVGSDGSLAANPPAKVQETTAAQSTAKVEATVWLSRTGTKYHSKSSCSNMKNPTKSNLSDAINAGRTACSKCY